MQFTINYSFIVILFIGLTVGEIHNACEICSCDNLDQPTIVHCDSKNFSTLTNLVFNSSIETLTLINNSLTFKAADDLIKINNITSLKSLVLSNNPLESIPEFSAPHLINLQLENTDLKTAAFPQSYENCTNLQSIVLSNNTLMKITSDNLKFFSSLTKIVIDNADLHSIDQNAFVSLSKTLQSISLESNSLTSAEFFSTMQNLRSINFDNNKFKRLPKEMLEPGRTKYFSFRNNQIDTIDETSPLFHWTRTNLSDIEIYLNNNPIDCCQSRWFIRYLTSPKNLVKDASNLTCASPKLFIGKRLIDLHVDLMNCSHNPKIHMKKFLLILLCLSGVVMFILFVVGATLYRRNKLHIRRRRGYQVIQGDD